MGVLLSLTLAVPKLTEKVGFVKVVPHHGEISIGSGAKVTMGVEDPTTLAFA